MSDHETRPILRCGSGELYGSNSTIDNQNRATNQVAMAASYTEIAFQSRCPSKNGGSSVKVAHDPAAEDEYYEVDDNKLYQEEDYECQHMGDKKPPKRPVSLSCDKSFPYDMEGTVRREGEMTYFVAENLEYKIKLSSPITKRDINHPNASSKNSTPSTSAGILPRHFLQSQLAQIDSNVLSDIEIDAQYLAASVDNLTENLYNLLHSVSSITADNVEIHKNSVNKLTDNMDANIKCMYTIMAKTEEISKSMKPTEQLALRIREIKRLVDMLENNL